MADTPRPPDERPEFGPTGYLPERASKRARKIVLRAPLGLQWMVAALVAGLVVVVAGVLFLQRGETPPPAPWVELAPVARVGDALHDAEFEVLAVGATGRVRVFADAAEIDYCAASNRLEASDGRVWSLTGRAFADGTSLEEYPSLVQGATLYMDPTRTVAGPTASGDRVEPACA
ncbi:MAG: hypothetical protein WD670_04230 [Actinomycetota bacterium]